jgi:predicted dehydrogenase
MTGIRVGVVGAGAIAQLAHLPLLAKIKGAELVALCDNDRAKARALADRFSIPDVFTDIEDLFEDGELDAVVVTTPNHLHEPHTLSALAAGVNVLCERPLALTRRGVERILSAAARSDVQALVRFLRGGELGRFLGVRAGSYKMPATSEGWRNRRAEAGGGAFLESGFPLLDLALWIADFPDPLRVSATMERARGAGTVEDSMLAQIECAQGKSFLFDTTRCYVGEGERWWFEVLCSRGSARLAPLRVFKELNGRATDVSPTGAAARESVFLQSYRAELAHFIAVLDGSAAYEAPTDQVTVHNILEAIYRSAEEGKEIRL